MLNDFNPRTPYGMRQEIAPRRLKHIEYFNPRTPYGMRLWYEPSSYPSSQISIHVPLTGCDGFPSSNPSSAEDFNPRTPYGMRPFYCSTFSSSNKFQSTHPLRDATSKDIRKETKINISIHAPLTGCDCIY